MNSREREDLLLREATRYAIEIAPGGLPENTSIAAYIAGAERRNLDRDLVLESETAAVEPNGHGLYVVRVGSISLGSYKSEEQAHAAMVGAVALLGAWLHRYKQQEINRALLERSREVEEAALSVLIAAGAGEITERRGAEILATIAAHGGDVEEHLPGPEDVG